jgi:hypothetical protein
MANYFQTGFTSLQELAKMKKEHVVIETPNPVEGQQALDKNGVLVVYSNGKWISEAEYDRLKMRRLGEIGDCV